MASIRGRVLPNGEKRYDVVWRCSGCEKHPKGGKQHVKTFVRRRDAEVFDLDKTREEITGEPMVPTQESVTFGTFAGLGVVDGRIVVSADEGWFSRYRVTIAPGSYKRRTDVKNHLKPLLDLPLTKVTAARVDDIVTAVSLKHPRTARVTLETIRMILRNARLRGHKIDEMVLLPPRDGGLRPARYEPAAKTFLTHDQVGKLAEVSRHADLVWFTALTGLRAKEVFGLEERHLIRGAGGRITAVHITRDITKSDAGVRTIPLFEKTHDHLVRAMLARTPGATHLFCGSRGGEMNRSWFDKQMRDWTEKAGITATFHALRHTFASWMIEAGVNPKTIQALMGHENWSVTMDTYGHLFPTATSEAMKQLGRFLTSAPANRSKVGPTPLVAGLV